MFGEKVVEVFVGDGVLCVDCEDLVEVVFGLGVLVECVY